MKFAASTLAIIALGAIASTTEAVVSAGCTAYLATLAAPSPLAACRTYTALGFPGITGAHDHNTTKLQGIIDTFCATPACTDAQYAQVTAGLTTNCKADISTDNADLTTAVYMWYLSPAQRQAICFKDAATNGTCVIETMNSMIASGQLPDNNVNQDDLYGYLQYATPVLSPTGMNTTSFCSPCNQQVANIFNNYYTKTPSTLILNSAQALTSDKLKTDLAYQYKTACGSTFGGTTPTGNTTTAGDFNPSANTKSGASGAAGLKAGNAGSMVAVLSVIIGAVAFF